MLCFFMVVYALLNINTKHYHYKKTLTAMGIFPSNKILLSFIIPSVGASLGSQRNF